MFIPSIMVLIIAALICFFILPNMSAYVLGILCMAMFALGIWQHYSMFPYEYRTSVLSDMLRDYSGFVMLLAIILVGIVAMGLLPNLSSSGNSAMASAASIIPEVKMPNVFAGNSKNNSKGNSKNFFNLSGNSANSGIAGAVGTAVSNVSKTVSGFMNQGNQTKSNNLVSPSFKVS